MCDDEISFREFVRKYTPKGWREPASNVIFVPYWDKHQYENMKQGKFDEHDKMNWLYKEALVNFLEVIAC